MGNKLRRVLAVIVVGLFACPVISESHAGCLAVSDFAGKTVRPETLQTGTPFNWDLLRYPILAWKWKPRALPAGSNGRNRSTNQLSVDAVFPARFLGVKTIKYVWSASAPIGTLGSTSKGRTRTIVIRSGVPRSNSWADESVNVARDYQRLFGESPKQLAAGIEVPTDSDETYAAFRVCPPGQTARRAGAGLLFFSSMNGSAHSRP